MKSILFRYLPVFAFCWLSFFSCDNDEVVRTSILITSPADEAVVQGTVDIQYELTRTWALYRIEVIIDYSYLEATYYEAPETIQINTAHYSNGPHIVILRAVYGIPNMNHQPVITDYWSNAITLDIQNPVIIVPSVPVLQATSDFENTVSLRWNENLEPVSGYRIKRKLNEGDYVTLAELPADATDFVDEDVVFDLTNQYSYKLEAYTDTRALHSNTVRLIYRTVGYVEYKSFTVPETADGEIAITPDGEKVVVTNYLDDTFTVINVADGSSTALAHTGGSMGLCISHDGTFMAVQGTHDMWVDIWNLGSLTRTRQIDTQTEGYELALNRSGSTVVLGDPIRMFGTASGDLVQAWEEGHYITRSIVFSNDETLLLTAGNDNLVKLWNAETGTLLKTFTGHPENVGSARFINDEAGVISGSYEDGIVRMWDVANGSQVDDATFTAPIVAIVNVGGKKLAIATATGSIFLSNERVSSTFTFGRSLKLFSLAYAPAGEILAAYYQQKVVLYKPTTKAWEIDQ